MPSRQAISAGRAFVEVFLKDDMTRNLRRTLRNAGDSMKKAGRGMMAAGAAILAPFALGLKEFANFDAKMRNVATMLDAPDDFLPNFRQGIKDLSTEFGKTKDELATGLYDILSATVPPEQAMQRLAAATKLAAAGNADVGDSVSVLNTLMDTYGDSFKDAADASDFLFSIVKRGRTNLTELSGSLGDIIAIAHASGMSVEDMGASVALLTRATGKTESALTALQAISGTFLKPGIDGAKLWKDKFKDAMDASTLKAIGMTGVLERLSTLDAGEVATIFPNMRAIRGIFPAIEKMEGFSDDLKGMADRAGNVDVAFKKGAGPLREWQKGVEQIKNILMEIGKATAETILPHIEAIKGIAQSVQHWIEDNKQLVVTIGAIGAGLLIGGAALYAFGSALGGAATTIKAVGIALKFMIANPILAGVAALAFVIYKLTDATAKLDHTQQRALEKGDALRRQHQAQFRELQTLADKQSLSNDEMARAETIISSLEKVYGDLGIRVNKTTGEIEGMSKAQTTLNKRMSSAAKAEANAALAEARANLGELRREQRETGGLGFMQSAGLVGKAILSGGDEKGMGGSGTRALGKAAKKEMAALDARIDVAEAQEQAAKARLAAIQAGEPGALTGGAEDTAGAAAAARGQNAAPGVPTPVPLVKSELGDFGDLRGTLDRLAEMRIRATKDGIEEEIALIRHRYAIEMRQAKIAGDSESLTAQKVALLQETSDLEIADARKRQAERDKAGQDKEQKKLAEALPEPRVTLTATYSAAAAQIAGYQAAGPEQEMARGIEAIRDRVIEGVSLLQQFLAGWKVT
jgi:TP901 family phage tail tape measure protein